MKYYAMYRYFPFNGDEKGGGGINLRPAWVKQEYCSGQHYFWEARYSSS